MSVRVLIVDDQAPFRDAARAVVEATDGFEVVGESGTGEASIEAAAQLTPDLVLMDVNLPGINGLEATRRISQLETGARVLILTVHAEEQYLLPVVQAGGSGYVLKDVGPSELQHALLAAVRSESPVPRKMIPEVLRRVAAQSSLAQTSSISLTSRLEKSYQQEHQATLAAKQDLQRLSARLVAGQEQAKRCPSRMQVLTNVMRDA